MATNTVFGTTEDAAGAFVESDLKALILRFNGPKDQFKPQSNMTDEIKWFLSSLEVEAKNEVGRIVETYLAELKVLHHGK